jgi:hypothetical protein
MLVRIQLILLFVAIIIVAINFKNWGFTRWHFKNIYAYYFKKITLRDERVDHHAPAKRPTVRIACGTVFVEKYHGHVVQT